MPRTKLNNHPKKEAEKDNYLRLQSLNSIIKTIRNMYMFSPTRTPVITFINLNLYNCLEMSNLKHRGHSNYVLTLW
jgi:hypothetical protein